MSKKFPEPQGYEDGPRLPRIPLHPVESSQVQAIGYDPASKTLAVRFTSGTGAIYQYPNVSPETYAAFSTSSSIGKYFGQHIKQLPFKKYRAETETV